MYLYLGNGDSAMLTFTLYTPEVQDRKKIVLLFLFFVSFCVCIFVCMCMRIWPLFSRMAITIRFMCVGQ